MRKTELTFAEGFISTRALDASIAGNKTKTFDWDKAAKIIKDKYVEDKNTIAEAGLQRDWDNTAGIIFEDGSPTNDGYMYLTSIWAIPTLIVECNGIEEEIECWKETDEDPLHEWTQSALDILEIPFK